MSITSTKRKIYECTGAQLARPITNIQHCIYIYYTHSQVYKYFILTDCIDSKSTRIQRKSNSFVLTCVLNCVNHDLHVWMPSYHVWSSFVSRALPQFLNHEPPWPQQLLLPDVSMVPHLGHVELISVVVCAGSHVEDRSKKQRSKLVKVIASKLLHIIRYTSSSLNLRLQAPTRANHMWSTACCRHSHSSCTKHRQEHNAGFLDLAAPEARPRFGWNDVWHDDSCSDYSSGYEISFRNGSAWQIFTSGKRGGWCCGWCAHRPWYWSKRTGKHVSFFLSLNLTTQPRKESVWTILHS